MPASPGTLRTIARRMRHEPAFNERALWKLLRNRRLDDLKFRRQVPIGPYIVDFVCFGARLVVEADGPLHDPASDALRDAWLKREGFTVLRFPNSRISQEPRSCWQAFSRLRTPHPTLRATLSRKGRWTHRSLLPLREKVGREAGRMRGRVATQIAPADPSSSPGP
jgi:very-short-patch-repair endonuclease